MKGGVAAVIDIINYDRQPFDYRIFHNMQKIREVNYVQGRIP